MVQTGEETLISPADRPDPSATGKTLARDVLVVDDDPIINELVCAYVQLIGLPYRGVLTGNDAVEQFHQRTPAMIVLDLMLPDLSGFDVCRQIRADPAGRDLPIVMLTAMPDEGSRRRGMEVGTTDYLTKPFDPDRLLDLIKRYGKGTAGELKNWESP